MRVFLFSIVMAVSFAPAAQSVSTTINYDKKQKPGLMLYLPFNPDVAEGTILAKLKETGYEPETSGSLFWKQDKIDGFYQYKGVNLKGQVVDLYFKIDRRGSKKDEQSVIYLLTSKGGENFVSQGSDADAFDAAKKFLNGFVAATSEFQFNLQLKEQEQTVVKAEKKLTDLQQEQKDLEEKIAKLQKELQQNRDAQEHQQKVIEAEKKRLEDMNTEKNTDANKKAS